MLIIGCDFHPTFQQIALTDSETGEYGERRLYHPQEAKPFYRALAGKQVRVGMEATGGFRWFRRLLSELGHELWLGNPTQIRASAPRRQKTDKRDARQLLKLLLEERFPQVWLPTVAHEDLRQLLGHQCRLVRQRTKLRNQLDAIAKNEGLVGLRVGTQKGRRQLEALPLTGWYQQRRQHLSEYFQGSTIYIRVGLGSEVDWNGIASAEGDNEWNVVTACSVHHPAVTVFEATVGQREVPEPVGIESIDP